MYLLVRAALVLALVMLSLFAWRGWRELPALARAAAAVAAVIVILLGRSPGALFAAGLLTWALASWISARKR